MFNPLKAFINLMTTVFTVLLLAYTHTEAFKMGLAIQQNPITHKAAELFGVIAPKPTCSSFQADSTPDKPE